jgi:hypothetical protein
MPMHDSPRDQVLELVALDPMFADEVSGNSEAPTGYFGMMVIDNLADAQGVISYVLGLGIEIEGAHARDMLGNFLVTKDDQGFLYVESYDTQELLEEAYTERLDAYEAWVDAEEVDV